MKFIGITGGVGAGKSTVISYLAKNPKAQVLLADDLAKELMAPGTSCAAQIEAAFGKLSREEMAATIYSSEAKRAQLNAIVHPAVKAEALARASKAKAEGKLDFFFFEAALLLEDGYDTLCDEIWYIFASEEVRTHRLKESRGYSEERIKGIFASQLSEEEFRARCARVIDNSGSQSATINQIDKILASIGN